MCNFGATEFIVPAQEKSKSLKIKLFTFFI